MSIAWRRGKPSTWLPRQKLAEHNSVRRTGRRCGDHCCDGRLGPARNTATIATRRTRQEYCYNRNKGHPPGILPQSQKGLIARNTATIAARGHARNTPAITTRGSARNVATGGGDQSEATPGQRPGEKPRRRPGALSGGIRSDQTGWSLQAHLKQ